MTTLALTAPRMAEHRTLGPIRVRATTGEDAAQDILAALSRRQCLRVAFANTHLLYCAVREPVFARTLQSFYILNDGVGVTLLSRLVCGAGFHENLNGTDFTPRLLAALPEGTRVFLVGARPEVAAAAFRRSRRAWPHLDICGWCDGFDGSEAALDSIETSKPDIVLVAMGNPRQERWIARAAERAPNSIFIGVGAWFDFFAGVTPRAPLSWRKLRLEWAFRLLHEPRRLWRRYTIEILVVLAALLQSSMRRSA